MGKDARIMARSLIDDNTPGSVSIIFIAEPTAVNSVTGTVDIFENADTQKICSPNSVIKYVNLRFQSGIRDVAPSSPGFVEYGIVALEEQTAAPTVPGAITAAMGTQTLGEALRNFYRGNCIWQGSFRVSKELPEVLDLKIKLPPKFCANKRGKFLVLFKTFKTLNVADTTTTARTFYSHDYKCYI